MLDDREPMRMPVQTVQRCIRGSSSNTSCKVLPLPSVYGLPIEVVNLAAQEARCFIRKVDRRKIVEEVYAIERVRLLNVR